MKAVPAASSDPV